MATSFGAENDVGSGGFFVVGGVVKQNEIETSS